MDNEAGDRQKVYFQRFFAKKKISQGSFFLAVREKEKRKMLRRGKAIPAAIGQIPSRNGLRGAAIKIKTFLLLSLISPVHREFYGQDDTAIQAIPMEEIKEGQTNGKIPFSCSHSTPASCRS